LSSSTHFHSLLGATRHKYRSTRKLRGFLTNFAKSIPIIRRRIASPPPLRSLAMFNTCSHVRAHKPRRRADIATPHCAPQALAPSLSQAPTAHCSPHICAFTYSLSGHQETSPRNDRYPSHRRDVRYEDLLHAQHPPVLHRPAKCLDEEAAVRDTQQATLQPYTRLGPTRGDVRTCTAEVGYLQ
jgi:hypothetical protein